MTTLDLLTRGGRGVVVGFDEARGDAASIRRLQDLGFRVGESVEYLRRAPMGDPVVFRVCDYEMCLRRREAALIRVDAA